MRFANWISDAGMERCFFFFFFKKKYFVCFIFTCLKYLFFTFFCLFQLYFFTVVLGCYQKMSGFMRFQAPDERFQNQPR